MSAMNVGQVQFSIIADKLDDTLKKAEQLQSVLNNIDGSKVMAGAKKTSKDVAKAVEKEASATAMANNNIKLGNLGLKERFKTSKRIAKLDKETQKNANKLMKSWLKEADAGFKQEQANLHKQYVANERNFKARLKNISTEKKLKASVAKEEQMQAERIANAPKEYRRNVQTFMAQTGAQMQSLGNALVRVASPFENVFRGLTMGIGYRLLGKVTESISGAFSRYDTIETYAKVLNNLGLDATKKFSIAGEEATDVYHNLENAVLGLPTGIDEIIASMRRYAGATGDVERATKLAIAANNAYIAGYMGEREKLFTERQLVALAGGAELSTNQWDSLRRNAPLAMKVVSKSMKMSVQEMVDALKEGTISGQEFLDVFIKAGTEGKLKDAAQVMKQTWDAVSQNVQNRMNAMGEGILKTLDSVFKEMDGRTFLQHVLGVDKNGKYIGGGIRGVIDNMAESAKKWIKANPEAITNFFENLSKIDWNSIVGGFAEFGFNFVRVAAALGKYIDGGFIKKMLGLGIIGRALGIGGGLVKGSATIMSWILTFAKFHGAGKLGTAIKNLTQIGKSKDAITGAVDTVAGATLSWQQVGNKAVSIAAVPAMAWSLKEVALALQEFGKLDLKADLAGKILAAAGAVTAFGALATAMGALITNAVSIPVLGQITAAGTIAGIGSMAGIAKAMKWVGEGLNAITHADIPSMSQIEQVTEAMNEIATGFEGKGLFEALGLIFDSWAKGAEFKTITKITDAFKSIKQLSKIKIGTGAMEQAKQNFADIGAFISGLETLFSEEGMREAAGADNNGVNWRGNTARYSDWAHQVSSFADIVQNVTSAMMNMKPLVKAALDLQKYYGSLGTSIMTGKSNFSWYSVQNILKEVADGMYGLVEGGKGSALYKLKDVTNITKNLDMQSLLNALNIVPKIIKKLTNIGEVDMGAINLDNLDTLGEKINTFITKISGAFSSAGAGFGGVSGMAMNAGAFLAGVNAVRKAINKLNSIPTAKDMSGIVASVKTAVSQLREIGTQVIDISITIQGGVTDMVTPQVTAAADAISKAMDTIEKEYKKDVKIIINNGGVTDNVTPAINRIASNIRAAINSIPSSVTKRVKVNVTRTTETTFVGGGGGHASELHRGGRIHPLYRANGGSIFMSRGTDTVPAMLTPGEYVINRMAASRIGDGVLWKLNHMDIAGALRSLSARAGQSITPRSNIVNNTTNNTRNATVNLHNYNGGSMGTVRAGRWAHQLSR